jgi:hypothetical protein
MNPAKSIASLKKNITGTIRYNDVDFSFTIYPNPHKKSAAEQAELVRIFGNRIQKGTHCLGITEEMVADNIIKRNYDALVYVKNNTINDSATAALQYYNWCDKNPTKRQMWIHDLCRVNNSELSGHDIISPIRILLDVVENFSKSKGIPDNYLFVESGKPGTNKLLEIYGAYSFSQNTSCVSDDSIAMRKILS